MMSEAASKLMRQAESAGQDNRLADARRRLVAALALYRSHERTPPLDLANTIRPLAILKDDAGEVEP